VLVKLFSKPHSAHQTIDAKVIVVLEVYWV